MVGDFDLAPSEYWQMTPAEVWLFVEAKRPEIRRGNLSERDLEELAEMHELYGDELL